MVTPTGPSPRIGQTTIRPTQIIRTTNQSQIRPLAAIRGQTTIVQTNNLVHSQPPALHPVSGTTIISGGNQVIREFFSFFASQSFHLVDFLLEFVVNLKSV